MADAVLQAREGADRRVRATGGRCDAENELEEALLELTVRNDSHVSYSNICISVLYAPQACMYKYATSAGWDSAKLFDI